MPSPTHHNLVDERGFIFLLPKLGDPDPAGDWVCVKAAIGTKEDALYRLMHDKEVKMPLRKDLGDDRVIMPIHFNGSLLMVPLLKPASTDPNAPPEFFSVFAKHAPLGDILNEWPIPPIPDDSAWGIFPMDNYEAMTGKAKKQGKGFVYALEHGNAAKAALWKPDGLRETDSSGVGGAIAGGGQGRKVYVGKSWEEVEEGNPYPTIILAPEPEE